MLQDMTKCLFTKPTIFRRNPVSLRKSYFEKIRRVPIAFRHPLKSASRHAPFLRIRCVTNSVLTHPCILEIVVDRPNLGQW
jgi:hypothetical protein